MSALQHRVNLMNTWRCMHRHPWCSKRGCGSAAVAPYSCLGVCSAMKHAVASALKKLLTRTALLQLTHCVMGCHRQLLQVPHLGAEDAPVNAL